MAIQTRCPNPKCAKPFQVGAETVGRKARCKHCSTLFLIRAGKGELISSSMAGSAVSVSVAARSAPKPTSAVQSTPNPVNHAVEMWEVGTIVLDDYRVERHLGR